MKREESEKLLVMLANIKKVKKILNMKFLMIFNIIRKNFQRI